MTGREAPGTDVRHGGVWAGLGPLAGRVAFDRRAWALPLAAWTLLVGMSFAWNWRAVEAHIHDLAESEGRFVFSVIESVRLWNARHGGVYVPVDENTRPNPYLKVPERDIATPSGVPLTKVNPAFMTRQLTEVVRENSGIMVHLTSLKPLNPGNSADPWETATLLGFERGGGPRLSLVETDGDKLYRFMAPLVTREACLACHREQGYKLGDIRGGLSVSFPAEPLLALEAKQKRNVALVHAVVWLLLCCGSLFFLSRFRSQMLFLKRSKEQQDLLIAQRTVELHHEIHERQRAEQWLRLLIDSSAEGIIAVDRNGDCTLCNPTAVMLLGYRSADELIGRHLRDLVCNTRGILPGRPPDCRFAATYRDGIPAHADDTVFIRADDSPMPVEYRASPLYDGDEVAGAVITFADITVRKQHLDRAWHQANHDALTDLPNRNLFRDRLTVALAQARRSGLPLAVLFIDLDGFKKVNDSFGHEAGDAVLKEAAKRIAAYLRHSDTVARLGGDEFAVLLPQAPSLQEVKFVAERIIAALGEPIPVAKGQARIAGSVGIALYPQDGETADALLKKADIAMYDAKRQGGGAYRFHGHVDNGAVNEAAQ